MKVRELIEELQRMDEEMDVEFVYDYGDHCHTNVTEKVRFVEEAKVTWSEYHRQNRLVSDEDEEYYEPGDLEMKDVVLLSAQRL